MARPSSSCRCDHRSLRKSKKAVYFVPKSKLNLTVSHLPSASGRRRVADIGHRSRAPPPLDSAHDQWTRFVDGKSFRKRQARHRLPLRRSSQRTPWTPFITSIKPIVKPNNWQEMMKDGQKACSRLPMREESEVFMTKRFFNEMDSGLFSLSASGDVKVKVCKTRILPILNICMLTRSMPNKNDWKLTGTPLSPMHEDDALTSRGPKEFGSNSVSLKYVCTSYGD